jgi:hypothetical protein
MSTWLKGTRIIYEVIGGLAICICLLWWAIYTAGGLNGPEPCVDTQLITAHSPGGKETAQQRYRTCGSHSSVEVLLNVPQDKANFMRVISLAKVPPTDVSFEWTGPNDLTITFPASAEIEEAYGVIWGVTITRNPTR